MDYFEVATQHEQISKNQASAGEQLISLIDFKGRESVLDLGCGTGNLTFALHQKTNGLVIGIDPSRGMIQQAKKSYGDTIQFEKQSAEEMHYVSAFDVIFCNSVLHWFKDPIFTLQKIHRAIKSHGVFALQTPVKAWCDFLVNVIEETCEAPPIKEYMKHYANPWFHLAHAKEYKKLLEENEFKVHFYQDERVSTQNCDVEKIIGLFNSGPAQAYCNAENYAIQFDAACKNHFMRVLREKIKKSMRGKEKIHIHYNRAFLLAKKVMP